MHENAIVPDQTVNRHDVDVRVIRHRNRSDNRHAAAVLNTMERLEYFAAVSAQRAVTEAERRQHAERIVAATLAILRAEAFE